MHAFLIVYSENIYTSLTIKKMLNDGLLKFLDPLVYQGFISIKILIFQNFGFVSSFHF